MHTNTLNTIIYKCEHHSDEMVNDECLVYLCRITLLSSSARPYTIFVAIVLLPGRKCVKAIWNARWYLLMLVKRMQPMQEVREREGETERLKKKQEGEEIQITGHMRDGWRLTLL